MKRASEYTLKEVIQKLLRAYRWDDKLDEARLADVWESVVGGIIARHTVNISLKNKTLHVRLDSAVLRNELMMARSKVIDSLNEAVGKQVIEELILQ